MFDTHIHTEFSTDSEMKIEEAIAAANEEDIGITLTDHMDTNHPKPGMFVFDVDEYFAKYNKYRDDKLLLGIEIGLSLEFLKKNEEIANNNSFDYVIGAIHFLDGYDLYFSEAYNGKTREQAFNKYLDSMYQNVKRADFIDTLAHIDYICRYAIYEDKELHYEEYQEKIDAILKLVIDKGIVLELNTRRLNDRMAIDNLLKIYKVYRSFGGKYVTLASDAHVKENIGAYFATAQDMCRTIGLNIVYFKNRKIELA
ncbi:histidinol phosphate phosphatase [Clostridium oryzae]|uniref:Histidinol-phosphatase n=1 Tax=Clostridium oryzae TaxID=1450648 RepID=A0A1V4IU78_9CLOT|nr:histidinol phosphate phosphatase [Clostridium oryzae]OPJ63598.1 histidinol-phosphatase [Clostridium oryzae]